ncbi:MAG TPA: 50S ribosomal protein L15 [Candidatus Azoamicus sp. MARI]
MYLNDFTIQLKKKKRVGRGAGSGWGKTSCKGHKGQKARSGYAKKILFEGGQTPLYKRLPKFGFKNVSKNITSISSNALKNIPDDIINLNLLKKYNIVKNYIKKVKIINSGNLNKKFNINDKNISTSKSVNLYLNNNN